MSETADRRGGGIFDSQWTMKFPIPCNIAMLMANLSEGSEKLL